MTIETTTAALESPGFTGTPLDRRPIELANQFTRIENKTDLIDSGEECWAAHFVVDQQSFRFAISDSKEGARWMCLQFAKALSRAMESVT